jgi:ubiquinone/menaquinone biosynthesis C-methylase UbiE
VDDTDAERLKVQQIRHWEQVAPGWVAWSDWTERNFRPIGEWLADAARWAPGARALDVGCGAGFPALLGASRVTPGGTLVATDISPAMVAATAARAGAAGLGALEADTMDAEDLQFDAASFDSVTIAYGLMFCPNPLRAVTEACRVLRPGGRFAVATWDDPSKSPFFTIIIPAAAPILSLVAPQAGAPGPFRFASPTALEDLLRTGGFSRVRIESRPVVFECASVDEYLQLFSDIAWGTRIAALDDTGRSALKDAVARAVQPFVRNGCLRLVATSLCASAEKESAHP